MISIKKNRRERRQKQIYHFNLMIIIAVVLQRPGKCSDRVNFTRSSLDFCRTTVVVRQPKRKIWHNPKCKYIQHFFTEMYTMNDVK